MAATIPEFILITFSGSSESQPVYYKEDGSVAYGSEDMFSPLAKIAAEPATSNRNYVNLRLCCSNRYLEMRSPTDRRIVAVSNQPDEDTSKSSCTLFEPRLVIRDIYFLVHVNTGGAVRLQSNILEVGQLPEESAVKIRDWGTFVKLPPHVAFKGDNGKYLNGAFAVPLLNQLRYSSEDPNSIVSGHRVELMGDGHVRLRSDHYQRYWRSHYGLISADSNDATGQDTGTRFWPIKIDGNTIALRSVGANNNFCHRLNDGGSGTSDILATTVSTITTEAIMEVQELVRNRRIYNVEYHMDRARIFNETPYLAGTTTLVNHSDFEAEQSASITYQDEKSYTFSRGLSLTAGVTTNIQTGVPFIVEGKIEISFEINTTLQWDTTTTTTTSVTATGSVTIPPRSTAIVAYVGTRGTCDLPYSYTQEDQSSVDGTTNRTNYIDGTYKGVSCYNFSFRVTSTNSLDA